MDSRCEERSVAAPRRLLEIQSVNRRNVPPPQDARQGGNVKKVPVSAQRCLLLRTIYNPICIGSDDEMTVELTVKKEIKCETKSLVSEVKSGKEDAIADVQRFRIPLSTDSQESVLSLIHPASDGSSMQNKSSLQTELTKLTLLAHQTSSVH